MPLFTRRRLQFFLDELSSTTDAAKMQGWLRQLENKRVEQALPAEIEIALIWAVSRLGDMEIEPQWWSLNSVPDVYTEALSQQRAAVIEIASASDNSISGEEAMDRVAVAISDLASSLKSGSGQFLYFRFGTTSEYTDGNYSRKVLAPKSYVVSDFVKNRVSSWILESPTEGKKIRIVEDGLDVEIERSKFKQTRFHNCFSGLPPEAYSLEDNPLFKLLRRKSSQLKSDNQTALRLLFIADIGSSLLRDVGTPSENYHHYRKSGSQIISLFIGKGSVDGVVVFAPNRKQFPIGQHSPQWMAPLFARDDLSDIREGLDKLLSLLPPPRFEGYQVRSLFRQGAFAPEAHGWYLGMSMSSINDEMTVRVSARAFLDFLAGRITEQQLRHATGQRDGEPNLFGRWLDLGYTISKVEMDKRDIDQDDDHLVLHFEGDPAARRLQSPLVVSRPL